MKTVVTGCCLTCLLFTPGEVYANDNEVSDIAASAQDVRPLSVGATVPSLALAGVDCKPLDLDKAIKRRPTILIFYRGGWRPYCNRQLGQLQTVESKLLGLDYQILAISPDRPAKLAESINKRKLTYTLLSDHDIRAARSFGIAFRVDDATAAKYKGYGIDLEGASGEKHHLLPVPSAFIVGTDGVVKFSHANPDYKVRLSLENLLKAARAAATGETNRIEQILSRIREHQFHPIRDGFTFDRHLNKYGVANLQDTDSLVRTLAVRDLVRLGQGALAKLTQAGIDPARDFGPRIVCYLAGWRSVAISGPRGGFFLVYIAAPLMGGALAAFCFRFLVTPLMIGRRLSSVEACIFQEVNANKETAP